MKTLIIGIDGGDQTVFEAFGMPRLGSLLQEGVSLKLTEDLWSRGWAKILTGKPGAETGAFYEQPETGRKSPVLRRSLVRPIWRGTPDVVPMWELAAKRNVEDSE